MNRRTLLGWLLLLILLTACTPRIGAGQPVVTQSHTRLENGHSIGQTFTATHAGMIGVEIYLTPVKTGSGQLVLSLRPAMNSEGDLAKVALPVTAVDHPGFYRFSLPLQKDSTLLDYAFQLTLTGEGQVALGTASGDTYLSGALYQDGEPVDAQVTFRLVYDPIQQALGLIEWGLHALWLLCLGSLAFLLPGWGILGWLWPGWRYLSWGEKLGLSAGVSLAVIPTLLLWTSLIGIHLGAGYVWGPIGVGALLLLFRRFRRPQSIPVDHSEPRIIDRSTSFVSHTLPHLSLSPTILPDLGLLLLLGLVFLIRLYSIRTITIPLWGDSYQHTLIAQLIVDHRGLFSTWAPYTDLQTLTYHFGFHSLAAAYHWVSGLSIPQAVLWTGQILNGLAILTLYPLAVKIGRNHWAGVAAVLVAGLLTPMPMSYVNWGRYTQLAGQAILPVAILASWKFLDLDRWDPKVLPLSALVWGGLALSHYRILIFAIAFFPVLMLFVWRSIPIKTWLGRITLLGAAGAALFLPWFIHVYAGRILQIFSVQISAPVSSVSDWLQGYNNIGNLASYLPPALWLLLPLCLGWAFWRREKAAVILAGWWFLIFLMANPGWLRLPGTGIISNFAVFIAIYIPASILLGCAVGWFSQALCRRRAWLSGIAMVVALTSLGSYGAIQRLRDLQVGQNTLVTAPDLRAFSWIEENTSPKARFLVNSFSAYDNNLIAGTDGGWWLPYFTGRESSQPPLSYGTELGPRVNFPEWVNALHETIQQYGVTSPQALQSLAERGYTHIYIGQRQGKAGNAGPDFIHPDQLLTSPSFRPVYHQDRVWIFQIVYP